MHGCHSERNKTETPVIYELGLQFPRQHQARRGEETVEVVFLVQVPEEPSAKAFHKARIYNPGSSCPLDLQKYFLCFENLKGILQELQIFHEIVVKQRMTHVPKIYAFLE